MWGEKHRPEPNTSLEDGMRLLPDSDRNSIIHNVCRSNAFTINRHWSQMEARKAGEVTKDRVKEVHCAKTLMWSYTDGRHYKKRLFKSLQRYFSAQISTKCKCMGWYLKRNQQMMLDWKRTEANSRPATSIGWPGSWDAGSRTICRVYQSSVQPLRQPLCSGVGDLTPQVVPLLVIHELQHSPQILQQVEHPEATQERWGGWLAVKQPVGVIHGLGAWDDGDEALGFMGFWLMNHKVNSKIIVHTKQRFVGLSRAKKMDSVGLDSRWRMTLTFCAIAC